MVLDGVDGRYLVGRLRNRLLNQEIAQAIQNDKTLTQSAEQWEDLTT